MHLFSSSVNWDLDQQPLLTVVPIEGDHVKFINGPEKGLEQR